MSVESTARTLVERDVGRDFQGFGVVYTDTPLMERLPRRRAHAREKEQRRLSEVVAQVIDCLRDTYDVGAARAVASEAGFADCVTVTEAYAPDELLRAVAERLRAGDNCWSAGTVDGAVASIYLWYDPSHRRVN